VQYGGIWFILDVCLRANGHGHKLHSLKDVFAYPHLSPLAPTAPAKPTMSLIARQTIIVYPQVCCKSLGRTCLHNFLGGEIRPDKNPLCTLLVLLIAPNKTQVRKVSSNSTKFTSPQRKFTLPVANSQPLTMSHSPSTIFSSITSRPSRFREEMSERMPKPEITRRDTFDDFVPPECLSTWKAEDDKKVAKKKRRIGEKLKETMKEMRRKE
jgi:hypothetical protein